MGYAIYLEAWDILRMCKHGIFSDVDINYFYYPFNNLNVKGFIAAILFNSD